MSIADLRIIENPNLIKVTIDLYYNRSLPIFSHGNTFRSKLETIFPPINRQTFTMLYNF